MTADDIDTLMSEDLDAKASKEWEQGVRGVLGDAEFERLYPTAPIDAAIVVTPPERIWLQTGQALDPAECTLSHVCTDGNGVEYVRADFAAKQQPTASDEKVARELNAERIIEILQGSIDDGAITFPAFALQQWIDSALRTARGPAAKTSSVAQAGLGCTATCRYPGIHHARHDCLLPKGHEPPHKFKCDPPPLPAGPQENQEEK